MSDTPRTDAEEKEAEIDNSDNWVQSSYKADVVDAEFSRTLERELNEAIARADALYKANVSATMVYEEWNAECKARAEKAEKDSHFAWESYAEANVERITLRAELSRLTTLRPASEHAMRCEAIWWTQFGGFCGAGYSQEGPYWTPLPEVKEATP